MNNHAVRYSGLADWSEQKRLANGQLQCDHCDFTAWYSFVMAHHRRQHHSLATTTTGREHTRLQRLIASIERPYACTKCEKRYDDPSRLKEHMACHSSETPLQCEHCDYEAYHQAVMWQHLKRHHRGQTDEGLYDGTMSLQRIPIHLVDHLSASTGLEYASYRSQERSPNGPSTSGSFSAGTESSEETDGWFEMESIEIDDGCAGPEQPCSAEAEVVEAQEEILASGSETVTAAKDSQRHRCPVCRVPSSCRANLRRHMLIHTKQEPLICAACGKGLRDLNSLKRHMLVHSDERPFGCTHCESRFKHQCALNKHSKKVHGRTPEKAPRRRNVQTFAVDQRQRKTCQRAFSTRERLNKRVNTNHNLVLCKICGSSFRDKGGLNRHLLVHSGERPFACSECDYTTRRRDSLALHQRRHSGELFRCAHCNYAHPKKAKVDRHSNIHRHSIHQLL